MLGGARHDWPPVDWLGVIVIDSRGSNMHRREPPSIDCMLQHLYASVLDPARFEDFAADLRLAMNAHLVALQSDDTSHRHNVKQYFFDDRRDVPQPDYANDASINLYFVRGANRFESNGVIDGTSLFAPGELERTAFYQEQLLPMDVDKSMGFCLDLTPSGKIFAMSVSRDAHRPAFEPETMQLARRLFPHLRNVYQLQQRLQQLESTASVMDRVTYGVWLLDGDGSVVKANIAAGGLLASANGGIHQRGQSLVATWRPDQTALKHAIECGSTRASARRSDFLLHDHCGQAWAACTVHPLRENTLDGWLPAAQATCLLLVHPLCSHSPGPKDMLRHVFGLTPAEAELADVLLQHGSLDGCASTLGKSHETLRTQLKALFAKTETHHQAELIRRLEASLG
jgi:DNA-binding CsgD family transcriptional regulator